MADRPIVHGVTYRTRPRARVLSPSEAAGQVRPYDFASPEPLTEQQRQQLDAGFESFAQAFAVQVTAKTRTVVSVGYGSFALLPFSALATGAEVPSGHVLCTLDGVRARMIYRLPIAEALLWSSRMLGGTGRLPAVERQLTAIERSLVWRMADEHVSELRRALPGLLPDITVDSFASALPFDSADAAELMVVAGFRLLRDGVDVPLSIAIPAAPVLAALGHGLGAQDEDEVAARLERHVADAPVEIAVRFDETRVGPSIVLSLGEGDVIPLAHPKHRPLAVTLDGDPVARAAVGMDGDRLACVVVEYEEAS